MIKEVAGSRNGTRFRYNCTCYPSQGLPPEGSGLLNKGFGGRKKVKAITIQLIT